MRWVIFFSTAGLVSYLLWYFKPPTEVLGSALPGWEDSDRRRAMIRAEEEQTYVLFRDSTSIH